MSLYIFNTVSRSIYNNSSRKNNFKYQKKIPYTWYLTDPIKTKYPYLTINSLTNNTGIIIRPYNLQNKNNYIKKIIKSAKKKSLIKLIAGTHNQSADSDGAHIPKWQYKKPKNMKIISTSVHSLKDIRKCLNLEANIAFISPIFKTSSHKNKKYIGVVRLGLMSRNIKIPVIALGGINDENIKKLRSLPIQGCAGIDIFEKKSKIQ